MYGETELNLGGYEDIINLFRDPDVKRARDNLRQMSRKLGIMLEEVPKYLEDYGDIFPCLSGYHPHPLYVVCLLGLQARAGAGALRRRSG